MDNSRKYHIAIAAIALLYIALRLVDLTDACLWFDEIFGVHAAEHSWAAMFTFLAKDLIHPPLFYVLLKVWIGIGGDGLLWLRLFSFVFAVASIVPFIAICRELKLSRLTTVVAFILFAVNGSLIKYAQEVRMYSLLMFFSLASIWFFVRYLDRDKGFVALAAVNVLLVHTHYFGWLLVASEIVAIAIFARQKIWKAVAMVAVAAMSFGPWAVVVYQAAASGSSVGQNIGWIERPGIRSIFDLLFDLIEPLYFQASSDQWASIYFISLPMLMLIGVAKAAYLFRWLSFEEKRETYLLETFIGIPMAIALIASWLLPHSVWGSRHLIIIYAPLLILSAVFLTDIPNLVFRRVVLVCLAFLLMSSFAIWSFSTRQEFVWCSWEKAATAVAESSQVAASTPTPIYALEDLAAYHLWFAMRHDERFAVKKVDGVEGVTEDNAYFLPRGFDGVARLNIRELPQSTAFITFRRSTEQNERFIADAFRDRGFTLAPIELPADADRNLRLFAIR